MNPYVVRHLVSFDAKILKMLSSDKENPLRIEAAAALIQKDPVIRSEFEYKLSVLQNPSLSYIQVDEYLSVIAELIGVFRYKKRESRPSARKRIIKSALDFQSDLDRVYKCDVLDSSSTK